MEVLFLFVGLLLGGGLAWFIAKSRFSVGITLEEIEKKYVSISIYEDVKKELEEKRNEVVNLNREISQYSERSRNLEQRIVEHKKEIGELQERMKQEFENISNKIFESKSEKFLKLNEEKVSSILNPLKERINDFEKKVDDTYDKEKEERISLKKELEFITSLNQKLSKDTENLTKALKGDKKLQGKWGEDQLEQILIYSGLEKGIHYEAQKSFEGENSQKQIPDFIIKLPDDKHLIVDSKVSLVAYEQYFNEEDDSQKAIYLKTHTGNIDKHIQSLGEKKYQMLYGINPPDYVMMFIPIEPALYSALEERPNLFEKALKNNVVLVSTSTLVATLRTISFIWKQEKQKNNVLEIARESGALYDKFCSFMEDLINLGKKLDGVKSDYGTAMNKLYESRMKGTTIIGRMENIKKLGANTTKSLPQKILDRIEE